MKVSSSSPLIDKYVEDDVRVRQAIREIMKEGLETKKVWQIEDFEEETKFQ
jgi:hypothetical protein